jgi:hypothetical protein
MEWKLLGSGGRGFVLVLDDYVEGSMDGRKMVIWDWNKT